MVFLCATEQDAFWCVKLLLLSGLLFGTDYSTALMTDLKPCSPVDAHNMKSVEQGEPPKNDQGDGGKTLRQTLLLH